MAANTSKPLASASFYGENRSHLSECNEPLPATEPALPPYLSDPLLGPSKVWKIFRKQQDALDFISSVRLEGELLPFSYESINYERLFLVAHPDIFWFRDCHKKAQLRNTYEIISKDAVSKLYFDLEFDPTLNGNETCDGNEMVKTFIRVVLYYVHKLFHVKYKMKDVLILDSSTDKKFSVHLIFQTRLVFRTNIDAGNFVKYVANELINIYNVCSDEEQLRFDIFKETTINIYAIKDLFVMNNKQTRVLLADLAVYTKNRLFRLYRSTKQGRNSPLLLSPINKFSLDEKSLGKFHTSGKKFHEGVEKPHEGTGKSHDPAQYERGIFLASLITYFREPPDPEMVKEFEKPALNPNYSNEVNLRRLEKLHSGQLSPTKTSPYPELDSYIRTRVQPKGIIYRNIHFPSTNITVYDIKGYRYCGNIGRWHRSQNIKLIADVSRGVYYQKCHDIECADYKSPEWPIPPEVLFKIRADEGDSIFENVELDALETREGTFQTPYEDRALESGIHRLEACESDCREKSVLKAPFTEDEPEREGSFETSCIDGRECGIHRLGNRACTDCRADLESPYGEKVPEKCVLETHCEGKIEDASCEESCGLLVEKKSEASNADCFCSVSSKNFEKSGLSSQRMPSEEESIRDLCEVPAIRAKISGLNCNLSSEEDTSETDKDLSKELLPNNTFKSNDVKEEVTSNTTNAANIFNSRTSNSAVSLCKEQNTINSKESGGEKNLHSEILSNSKTIPDGKLGSESKNIPDSKIVPKSRIIPDIKIAAKSKNIPDSKIVPESKNIPDSKIIPESKNIPDCESVPESKNSPDSKIVPKSKNIPDCTLASRRKNIPGSKIFLSRKNIPDILPTTIVDKTDQEMVLDYVRRQEMTECREKGSMEKSRLPEDEPEVKKMKL